VIFEYSLTQLICSNRMHAGQMIDKTDERSAHESALRKLPLPYSLALRLRDAGVAPEVVCEYIGVEESALEGIFRMAEAKLNAAVQSESPQEMSSG
jgi:hypothetical protein